MEALTSGEQAALPMVKSLLSRLRLPGAKSTKHHIKQAIVADSLADKQSDQELGGRGWAPRSPFELGQGLPPAADSSLATPAPAAAPAPRAPSLSAFSTPQPHNATEARGAQAGTPGTLATPSGSAPLCHVQPAPSMPPQKQQQQQQQQQQQRRPPGLQLPHGPAGGAPLVAQPSMDAPLPQQHSWGSPRSSDMQGSVSSSDTVAALLQEAHGQHSGGGAATGVGHGRSSGGGRPSGVPPLNLARLGITTTAAVPAPAAAAAAAGQRTRASAAGSGGGAAGAFDSHVSQSGCVAELEQELASWAAPPSWHPSSQGRWYVYPPIGRKDVAPVEALVSTLTPAQAAEVAVLWRQYAAARYSAELMAGRAVRMCRELTRELANSRAHTGHVAEQGAEHAEKLGQTIKSLQQQLDEARRAAAVAAMYGNSSSSCSTCSSCHQVQHSRAVSTAPAAAAPPVNEYLASPTRHHSSSMVPECPQVSGSTPGGAPSVPVPAPARPQLEVSACKASAARNPTTSKAGAHTSTVSAAAAALGLLETDDDGHSYSSCSSSPRPGALAALAALNRPHAPQQPLAAGPPGTEALRALACENEQLLAQLEHMRGLFLEAHADGRALREALEDVDAECAALRQHGSGLSRQAAAVLQENAGLRSEVEALRAALLAAQRQQQQQQPVAAMQHGPHAPAHVPRPPASLTTATSSRTPMTAPRPPVGISGLASAGVVAPGGAWTPPPGLAMPPTVAVSGAGVAAYSGHRDMVRTASAGPRPVVQQQEESQLVLLRTAQYTDVHAAGSSGGGGGSGSSGVGAGGGAGQVARALAHALETEGVVAVVQAMPTPSSGASNAQGRALSRSGSAPNAAPAAMATQQQQHQLYVRTRDQLQQQAAQGQQFVDEMAW